MGHCNSEHTAQSTRLGEAVFDGTFFDIQSIVEAVKRLPDGVGAELSDAGTGPTRLRDLVAHHYFAIDSDIIREVAITHAPAWSAQTFRPRNE